MRGPAVNPQGAARRGRRLLSALLASGLALGSPAVLASSPAPTDAQVERARELYDNGRALYEQGSYKSAILAFERAFELVEDPNLLYNISLSYAKLDKYDDAIDYLDRYRALAPKEERAKLEKKRRELEEQFQRQREKEDAAVAAAAEKEAAEAAAAAAQQATVDTEPKRDQIYGPPAWVLTGVAGVALAIGAGLGVSSLVNTRRANDRCRDAGPGLLCSDIARDEVRRSQTHALGADISFGIAGAAALAVIIIVAVKAAQRKKKERAAVSATPLGLRLRF